MGFLFTEANPPNRRPKPGSLAAEIHRRLYRDDYVERKPKADIPRPANKTFTDALAELTEIRKQQAQNRRTGKVSRFLSLNERRAWKQLMAVVRQLPPPRD